MTDYLQRPKQPRLIPMALAVVLTLAAAHCAVRGARAEVLCYPVIPDTVKCKQLAEPGYADDGEWTLHLAPGVYFDPRPSFPAKDWRPELRELEPGYLGPHTEPYRPGEKQ